MAPPLPWFPFYVADYRGDETMRSLTYEERGIFVELLCLQWGEASIPEDRRELARILGLPRVTLALRHVLDRCFVPNGHAGRLVNRRLAEEFVKQAGRSQKATERWTRWHSRRRMGNGGSDGG
jgi:uncharacterized protein YdaU (DUF1376 family)